MGTPTSLTAKHSSASEPSVGADQEFGADWRGRRGCLG